MKPVKNSRCSCENPANTTKNPEALQNLHTMYTSLNP